MGRPRNKPKSDIYVATDTGVWISPKGEHFDFWKDVTRVRVGHPLLEAMPDSFKEADVHYDVEQMTAAPGEFRGEEVEERVRV